MELGEGEVEGVEVVVAAGKLEGEGVVGEGVFEAAALDATFEEGAAFDGEIGFASGEIAAMDGFVVFEDDKAGASTKNNFSCAADFFIRRTTFQGVDPSKVCERCRIFCTKFESGF